MNNKNLITVDNDAIYWFDKSLVKMRLLKENRVRSIGFVDMRAKMFIKIENENGLHKESDSFGLPYSLIKWLGSKGITGIKIIYGGIHYMSNLKDWLEKGHFLYFKSQGIEKRLYLKRSLFK